MGSSASVKSNDRERMADDLKRLGLYATSTFVRKGKIGPTHGVEHVRHYVLPGAERAISERITFEKKYPPTPGTVGATVLTNYEERRDELQAVLDDWHPYNQGDDDGEGER